MFSLHKTDTLFTGEISMKKLMLFSLQQSIVQGKNEIRLTIDK